MENLKRNQKEILELKNTITEKKNSIEAQRQIWAGKRISKFEGRTMEIIKSKEGKKKN